MKYCSNCGETVEKRIPEDDNRLRHCCTSCESIHYLNPKIIVGTVPIKKGKVLLCKRAIPPRYGLWTIPAGFLENGETIEQGAFRETEEETATQVEVDKLYAIFNIPQIHQVYMLYLARVTGDDFKETTESLEVELFSEEDIPWEELAFPFVPTVLKSYFRDARNNDFPLTIETIERPKNPKN